MANLSSDPFVFDNVRPSGSIAPADIASRFRESVTRLTRVSRISLSTQAPGDTPSASLATWRAAPELPSAVTPVLSILLTRAPESLTDWLSAFMLGPNAAAQLRTLQSASRGAVCAKSFKPGEVFTLTLHQYLSARLKQWTVMLFTVNDFFLASRYCLIAVLVRLHTNVGRVAWILLASNVWLVLKLPTTSDMTSK